MTNRVDHLVTRLAGEPTDRALDGFEADFADRLGRRRAAARANSALAPVGMASVGLALAMGLVAGGAAAASAFAPPQHLNTFALQVPLAPSTLLEGR